MKKLMFATAVMAVGAAMAVESDVVGYKGDTLRQGNKGVGAEFLALASDQGVDLTDIVIKGGEGETAAEVNIQSLSANGKLVPGSAYDWYNFVDPDDQSEYFGWMDENQEFVEKGKVFYKPGEAVWAAAPSDAFAFQTSGKVDTKGVAVTLRSGNLLVCNPTPVDVDLVDVLIKGHQGETAAEVNIQSLSANGKLVAGSAYDWYNFIDPDDQSEYLGWMNENQEFVERGQKVFSAGEAIWVASPSTDFQIEYPGVDL